MYHFADKKKLKKADEFISLLRRRPVGRSEHFLLFYVKNSSELFLARLGLIISRRFARSSVERNLMKRIFRECFRQSTLEYGDYVIRLSRPMPDCSNVKQKMQVRKEANGLLAPFLLNSLK